MSENTHRKKYFETFSKIKEIIENDSIDEDDTHDLNFPSKVGFRYDTGSIVPEEY